MAASLLVLVGCAPTSQLTHYALPGCYYSAPDPRSADRPTDVVLQGCMQNGIWLEHMSWTSWGPQGADGAGTVVVNTCEFSCVDPRSAVKNPVVVHASNPQPAQHNSRCTANVQFYTDLVLAFPKTQPPSAYIPINARYDGMPASDVNKPAAPENPSRWGFPVCV